MATPQKTEAEKAPAEAVKATDVSDDDPTFSQERAIANSFDLVGESPEVVAGALSAVTKKNVTQAEVKSAVQKWLKAEVR